MNIIFIEILIILAQITTWLLIARNVKCMRLKHEDKQIFCIVDEFHNINENINILEMA